MKNGPYEMILAPENYPGKKYRERYAYEHTVVWWIFSGKVPAKGYEIHHKNMDHRDNRIDNLQLVTSAEHKKIHSDLRSKEAQTVQACGFCGKNFNLGKSFLNTRLKQNRFGKVFCSKSCGSKHQHKMS